MTGGEVSDFKGFDALVDDDLPTARVILADRGYDSDHIRKTIAERALSVAELDKGFAKINEFDFSAYHSSQYNRMAEKIVATYF